MKTAGRGTLFTERKGYLFIIHDLREMNLSLSFSTVLTQHNFLPSDLFSRLAIEHLQFAVAAFGELPIVGGD